TSRSLNCASMSRRSGSLSTYLSHRLLEVLRRLVPVHRIPPGLEVVGPAVLVLQVIGVLPHIDADHGLCAEPDRRVLVRGRDQLQLLVPVDDEPGPAGAE